MKKRNLFNELMEGINEMSSRRRLPTEESCKLAKAEDAPKEVGNHDDFLSVKGGKDEKPTR